MVIETFSAWFYGHEVDSDNQFIPLNEGSGEIAVEVSIGAYSLTNFITQVNAALNEFGSQEYTVSVNRVTRLVTISASSNFSLLFNSSSYSGISLGELLGFGLVDLTGSNSYTGTLPTGEAYYPQYLLQDFVDFDLIQKANAETVRTTASGRVEVVKYDNSYFMRCTIPFITNITNQGLINNNAQGLQDAINFMKYATSKKDLEFVYDIQSPSTFETCLLESTPQSPQGTDYELTPLYSKGLTGYYEMRNVTFRRL